MKKAVICFTRVPRPGVTKTRLLPLLTPMQCAELHRAFLQDLSSVYRQIDADLFVAYTPDADWEQLKEVFPTATAFFPQKGHDLGEKMNHAICHVLSLGYDAVILTGSDLPLMEKTHLESGWTALFGADVVLGSTSDGGYYLVGMKKPCPEMFEHQNYGTATVYEHTVKAVKAAGYTLASALPCEDVDTPDDLRWLALRVNPKSHTGRYLQMLRKEGILL